MIEHWRRKYNHGSGSAIPSVIERRVEMSLMKALIVYDSVYGNTEKIARAVAGVLASSGEVNTVLVGEVNPSALESIDFLIVGSPTQGARPTGAIQKFLGGIPASALKNVVVASFDTRISARTGGVGTRMIAGLAGSFGYAAGRIADSLKDKGGHLAALPEGFIVMGIKGPLKPGELERAAVWAQGILDDRK